MQDTKEMTTAARHEQIDLLIAISVVAKRLARKLEAQLKEGKDGQDERTVDDA